MRRRDALPENDRPLAVPEASLLTTRRPVSRRSRLLAVAVGAASIVAVGCGEDGNDAPGGSAPPASTPGSASPVGPGPGSPDTGPSPESADEAHPSVPVGTPADTDG
jgi:hypothetical protein